VNQTPISANLPLTVTLEAQHWNTIVTALAKAPYELVAPLIQSITEQLQQGVETAQAGQREPDMAGDSLDPPVAELLVEPSKKPRAAA
jgi:hypothetical protein